VKHIPYGKIIMRLFIRLSSILIGLLHCSGVYAQVAYPNYSIPAGQAAWCAANPAICYTGQPRAGDYINDVQNSTGTQTSFLNVIDYGNAIYNSAVSSANSSTDNLGNTTATALGGGSTYTAGTGVSAPRYSIQGKNYNNVGSAFGAVDNQLSIMNQSISGLQNSVDMLGVGLMNTNQRVEGNDRKAMQGIAIAGAMVAAPMPSAPGKTRVKLNNSYYRGYGASSISVAHRLPTSVPAAITAGISVGYRNSAMYSGGMEIEF
jgi:hypothetical protein